MKLVKVSGPNEVLHGDRGPLTNLHRSQGTAATATDLMYAPNATIISVRSRNGVHSHNHSVVDNHKHNHNAVDNRKHNRSVVDNHSRNHSAVDSRNHSHSAVGSHSRSHTRTARGRRRRNSLAGMD